MFEAWWEEFKVKDGQTGSCQIKLKQVFKGFGVRVSLKPYESADGVLSIDPPGNPNGSFAWLPQPPRKIELDEKDVIYWERNGRISLRALNFIEAILQTWKTGPTDEELHIQMRRSISRAVKCIVQAQVACVGGQIQARRDQFLAHAKGLTVEELQQLRHATVTEGDKLFPTELMKEIDAQHRQSLQTKALMKTTTKAESKDSSGKKEFKKHNYNNNNAPYNNYNNNYQQNWYAPSQDVSPPAIQVRSVSPLKKQGGAIEIHESYDTPLKTESEDRGTDTVSEEDYEEEKKMIEKQKEIPVGGKLQHFWRAWKAIKASKKVVRWARKGYRLPFCPGGEDQARSFMRVSSPPSLIPSYAPDSIKGKALTEMIQSLLLKHVIEPVPAHSLCFFNVVFLRPKPGGKWRLILDVSKLNKFLVVKPFVMDTAQVIRSSLSEDMWGSSVDFSDAFHHLPIHPNFKCFLAFQVGNSRYWYRACPFGLSPIPQVFTELCQPVKVYARNTWNVIVYQYIDDWLFLSSSRGHISSVTRLFVRLCIELGLTVNLEKSHLSAARSLTHLGVLWDFKSAQLRTPDDKITAITRIAKLVCSSRRSPLPLLETLMGKMVAVEKCVPFGRLHYRRFQRELLKELRQGRSVRWVSLTTPAKTDLCWWSQSANLNKFVRCSPLPPQVIIHTDASLTGWGAFYDDTHLSGTWSLQESRQHINVLEMRAVENLLRLKGASFRGRYVCLKIDNKSVVCYINKQGGTRSPTLMAVTARVLQLVELHNIFLSAVHVRGELNVLADMLSRSRVILKTEWRLHDTTFAWVCNQSLWGTPTIDLFANRLNTQLPRFISPCQDSLAVSVDALVCPWPNEICYAFPPPTIISNVCTKILQEQPKTLLLVAPRLPTTSWFPTLSRLAIQCILIPEDILSLIQPHWDYSHPSPQQLSLALWHITYQD